MQSENTFEPEVIFPAHPYDAACIYFGVMAYPEEGAGLIGAPGQLFATALGQYQMWAAQKTKGLRYLREARGDPDYVGPRRRDFRGALDRGLRRVDRRTAAYELYGSQLLTGFFAVRRLGARAICEGRTEEAFHTNPNGGPAPARMELWKKGMPSAHKIIRSSGDHWLNRFALNITDPRSASAKQRVKDVHRRGLAPSLPVLHMAHGLAAAAIETGPKIPGWGDRDPLLALLMNAELWIWDAIDAAETWRIVPHMQCGVPLGADRMVRLVAPAADQRALHQEHS